MMSFVSTLRYLRITFFCIFFLWISLLPQPVQDQYSMPVKIFLGIFLAFLLLDKRNFKHLFNFQDWTLWLFLISMLTGIVYATDKNIAFNTYSYLIITFLLLFYIGKGLFYYDDRGILGLIICLCSGLVALIGILELYYGKNILYENFIINPYYERYAGINYRPMSTQLNPAVLGSYLLGCLPFSFCLFRNRSLQLRLLGTFSSLLSMLVIILTFSRGVMLGFIALLIFYLWKMQEKKILLLFLFCFVLLVSVCSYQKDYNFNRFGFKRLISGSYDSVISEYRLNRVKMAFKILKDYPLFGIGFNHFRVRFNEYCGEKDKGKELDEFMIPDNMYLTFLAETGITGSLGFLVFIPFLFKRGFKKIKELENENKKQMLFALMSALIGLLVNMGAYDLFYWNNPYMLFCLICGFIQAAIKN